MKTRLIESITELVEIDGYKWQNIAIASNKYLEVLLASSPEEVEEMLEFVQEKYYMECPLWAKLVAFKLLILQKPKDQKIKKWATSEAAMFGGPTWKEIVEQW